MIQWRCFPSNLKPTQAMNEIVDAFAASEESIASETHELTSNEVLQAVASSLMVLDYKVETSKSRADKVRVPVLFGNNGTETLAFEADAYCEEKKFVIEVEAGRAVVNYQFLKDFFEACMMNDVEYFCVAVRKTYKKKNDFIKVCDFFDAMFVSRKIKIPLKGILVLGY